MRNKEFEHIGSQGSVEVEELQCAHIPVLHIRPSSARPDTALLHFHGGGYRKGSPRIFAESISRIADACSTQVFSVGYRLSGECAFPAAVHDAVDAYRWVTDRIPPAHVALWGDSAGGGLAAALLLRLRELELPSPAGAFLFSPWTDLRNISRSYTENAATDAIFSLDQAREAAAAYLSGHPATDPLASPALGDWRGQPPLVVQVSDSEVLRDDALALARTAARSGVDVRLRIHEGVPHIWNLAYPATAASRAAVESMVEQISELVGPPRP
jgi:monoterpene epsilon-lactone hydrolase